MLSESRGALSSVDCGVPLVSITFVASPSTFSIAPPIAFELAINTIAIKAMMRAFSMAVVPELSLKSLTLSFEF